MDELKPSEKLVGTVMVQTGFHHDEADCPGVVTAVAPNLSSVTGLQDRVAKTAHRQGQRQQIGGIVFD